jgi:hypothetical protein
LKYLCLIYTDGRVPSECEEEHRSYAQRLHRSGQLVAAGALPSEQTTPADAPRLWGFLLIEARDLNAALRVATEIPLARVGAVEVRAAIGCAGTRYPGDDDEVPVPGLSR